MNNGLINAFKFAREKHSGQIRKFSKKPYISHLVRTYNIVKHYTQDEDMLVAALLHDVVEDTEVEISEVFELFGNEVAVIVDQLTLVVVDNKKVELKKKVESMSSKSKIVKLADRTANVIGLFNPKVHRKFINEYINETDYVFGGVVIHDDFERIQTMLWKKLFKIVNLLKIKFN